MGFNRGEAVPLTQNPTRLLGHLLPVLLRSRPSIDDVKEEAGGECVGGGNANAGEKGTEMIVEAMRWGMVPSYSKADSASDALKMVCPKLSTLNSQPSTLNPKPYTLTPKLRSVRTAYIRNSKL